MDDISAEDLLAAARRRTSSLVQDDASANKPKKGKKSPATKTEDEKKEDEEVGREDVNENSDVVKESAAKTEDKKKVDEQVADVNGNSPAKESPAKQEKKEDDNEQAGREDVNDDGSIEVNAEAGTEGPGESAAVSEDEDDRSEEEESSEEEEDDDKSVDATDLLAAVKGRMEQQKLMDETRDLRRMLDVKEEEIKTLTGQLQMAISTKHSLLIVNSELEQRHEQDMQASVRFEENLHLAGRVHLNVREEIEKDFVNDLNRMAQRLHSTEIMLSEKEDKICMLEAQLTQKHIKEACTECLEKTETIALLQGKVHKLEKNAPRPITNKVKFYRKKLGFSP